MNNADVCDLLCVDPLNRTAWRAGIMTVLSGAAYLTELQIGSTLI